MHYIDPEDYPSPSDLGAEARADYEDRLRDSESVFEPPDQRYDCQHCDEGPFATEADVEQHEREEH